MKTLYIVRHAKSGWEHGVTTDFDRTLSERGMRTAPLMASVLKEKKVMPDLVISSPANRAITTAKLFCDVLDYPDNLIQQKFELYEGETGALLDTIREIPDSCRTAMIFGHNPSLLEFANLFSGKNLDSLAPCGVVRIDLYVRCWSDSSYSKGKTVWYEMPEKHTFPVLNPVPPSDREP
jgi:phosphohistidine phosphatase